MWALCWPGNLMVAARKFPQGGVFIFAIMAAGGDMGASIAPQLVGVVTDSIAAGGASEAFGMKCGLLIGAIFPLIAIPVSIILHKKRNQ